MSYPKVNVYSSVEGYTLKVAVYRHVASPKEISVHIESIYALPPKEPEAPRDSVAKLVKPGKTETFEVKATYPY